MGRKERVGIITSPQCSEETAGEKLWMHVRKFVLRYHPVLRTRRLYATEEAAEIIQRTTRRRKIRRLEIEVVGRSYQGLVKLAALVAEDKLDRVLAFQHRQDASIQSPEHYALLRNCDIYGKRFCINETARLWAQAALARQQRRPGLRVPQGPPGETVAFIAHDGEKERISKFVLQYCDVLKQQKFRMIATAGTKKKIEYLLEALRDRDPDSDLLLKEAAPRPRHDDSRAAAGPGHGPSGGDMVIADEIHRLAAAPYRTITDIKLGPLYHVLFFMDHNRSHPHEPDIQVLLRTCADPSYRVNLLLNSAMAREWAQRYRPL